MIKVTIIDDHIMILKGLKSMIDGEDSIRVYGTFCYGEDLLNFLKTKKPEIILMDIHLPDIDGFDLCKEVKSKYPEIKIITISSHNDSNYVNKMLKNGARGYLLKDSDKKEIIQAIKTVTKGEIYISASLKEKLISDSISVENKISSKITTRESEILQHIAVGGTNKEIANKLFISKRTVDTHRQNLLNKFGVNNAAELIRKAFIRGDIK